MNRSSQALSAPEREAKKSLAGKLDERAQKDTMENKRNPLGAEVMNRYNRTELNDTSATRKGIRFDAKGRHGQKGNVGLQPPKRHEVP
ncbi:hypothetical protein RUM44_002078 [Polyplax serrata]|uniref:Uncharacterized protein n=1 Tax=Polyplax serrata TaxID=468196 RepID=A0ABR1ALV8_POLSC